MADYVFIQNYSKNGKMGISHIVFDEIAIDKLTILCYN